MYLYSRVLSDWSLEKSSTFPGLFWNIFQDSQVPGAEQNERVAGSVLIILNVQFLQIIKYLNFQDFPGWTWLFEDFPALEKS